MQMNEAEHNSRGIDPESYAREIEPALNRLTEREQLVFALGCADGVSRFYRVFNAGELCVELAVRTVELWLTGKCDVEALKALQPKVKAAFERAMNAYDVTDQWNNIYNATPAGVVAYQATEASRSANDLLSAAIYSTEAELDDYMNPTAYCADAAAGALSATIFAYAEIDRQRHLLSDRP